MADTFENIQNEIEVIRTETDKERNTQFRVGGVLKKMLDFSKSYADTKPAIYESTTDPTEDFTVKNSDEWLTGGNLHKRINNNWQQVAITNSNIPDGAILIQSNGKIADSGWRSIGHPMNGKLRLSTMDVIRYDGIDLIYGNSIGAVKMYQQAGDNVIQITPNNGGLLKLGRTQYGTDLKTIWMGLINANDVVDAYRHNGSGNYFYYFGSDHNQRKIFKTRFGMYSNDAEFGSNTNYTYLGFQSDRVDVGMKANKIYLGIDSQNLYVGHLAPNIHIGGTNESEKPVQTVTIYRGGNSGNNPSAHYRVFQATQHETKIAGAGVGDMTSMWNVIVLRDGATWRAGGKSVVNVDTMSNTIVLGNNDFHSSEIQGINVKINSVSGVFIPNMPGLIEIDDSYGFMVADTNGKLHRISKAMVRDWLSL